jgi:hypothetical protein
MLLSQSNEHFDHGLTRHPTLWTSYTRSKLYLGSVKRVFAECDLSPRMVELQAI